MILSLSLGMKQKHDSASIWTIYAGHSKQQGLVYDYIIWGIYCPYRIWPTPAYQMQHFHAHREINNRLASVIASEQVNAIKLFLQICPYNNT